MILEIRHFRIIDAIRSEGTVSRAAKRLHLTQPAVSHALRDLESRLGVDLFRRERRRMVPTNEGERLLRAADAVLNEVHRAEHDLQQLKAGYQGVLRITTQCYTCYHWLPTVLRQFNEAFPRVELQIVPEATRTPFERLREGVLDLAIVHTDPDGDDIALRKLFSDELVAIVPPSHRLARKRYLEAQDFADDPLILHTNPTRSTLFQSVLAPANVTPPRVLELQLSEAVMEAVKGGIGISVMARWAVAPEVDRGALRALRVTRAGLCRTWYAAVLSYRVETPAIAGLIELLKREALPAANACAVPA